MLSYLVSCICMSLQCYLCDFNFIVDRTSLGVCVTWLQISCMNFVKL